MPRRVRATLSAGVAAYPHHGRTAELLLQSADRAMYAAKAAGRNRVRTAAPEAGRPAHR